MFHKEIAQPQKIINANTNSDYHECWKWQYAVLHDPAVQRKSLQENVAVIKEEANKGEVEWLRRNAEAHNVNENEAPEEEMLQWIRIVLIFMKRDKKRKNPCIRNMLTTRVYFSIGDKTSKCDIPFREDFRMFSPHGLESFVGKLEITSDLTSLRQHDEYDVTICAQGF